MSVITFKPNDHTKITTDFERYEFACPCGCTAQMIDPELVQKMQTIRTKLGKAIKVTSGYRCVKHNADPKVGGSRTSRHLYGIAADWRTKDRSVNPVALGIMRPRRALARSASTGTTRPPLSTPTRAEARLHGFASSPACIPAPPTTSLSCRPSSRAARELLTARLQLCCSGSSASRTTAVSARLPQRH